MRDVVAAVDVGGTRTKISYQDRESHALGRETVPTVRHADPAATVAGVVESVARAVASAPAGTRVVGVGMAVPGTVDELGGTAISAGNFGWSNVPFADLIQKATGLPFALSQDLRAGGRAEFASGAAQGSSSALFVPVGTGVGAAIVLDGSVWTGPHVRAGELGHLTVESPGVLCGCGRTGCVETVASASAIRRRYREATGEDIETSVIARRVAAGEDAAGAVWASAIDALATALDCADTLLDLDVIVIGGGLSLSGDLLLSPLSDELQRRSRRSTPVRAAAHTDWAGAVGAGIRAWEHLA